ncbi:MAG: ABC transporter permease [Chloroflexota bacterium]|nr:ABC transporter permease [Chloroflexota bacterium]
MATLEQVSPIELIAEGRHVRSESQFARGLRLLRRDYLTLTAMAILLILSIAAVGAPLFTNLLGLDPNTTDPSIRFQGIGAPGHLLGTDNLGRDQLARLMVAGRVSLGIGFFGAVIALSIGTFFGMAAGYLGGAFDDFIGWVVTTVDSIPSLFLLVLIASVLTPSATTLVLVVSLIGWTGPTRLMRGQTLRLRSMDYILSARAMGASTLRIMFVHILPNLFSITVISLASSIGGLILAESTISFLGLGVLPPEATWGNMLSNAQDMFRRGPHLLFTPGLMIFVTVLCLYIIGDGLRDAFDPKSQK